MAVTNPTTMNKFYYNNTFGMEMIILIMIIDLRKFHINIFNKLTTLLIYSACIIIIETSSFHVLKKSLKY